MSGADGRSNCRSIVMPPAFGVGPARLDRLVDDRHEVDGQAPEPELAGGEPRDLEQILDQPGLRLGVALDFLERPVDALRRDDVRDQHARPSLDGVERRPELVRQRHQEVVFEAVGFALAGKQERPFLLGALDLAQHRC